MKPYIKDDRTGLAYELVGDYYLPAGEDDLPPFGIWGRRRLSYLKTHRRNLYADLLLSGKLEEHLASIDADAAEMASRLTAQLARAEGVTESLKAAVADAKEKAAVLAEAAGLGELEIESIQEGSVYSYDSGVNNFSRKTFGEEAAMASPTVVRAAKISVSASVTVVFTVK